MINSKRNTSSESIDEAGGFNNNGGEPYFKGTARFVN